MLALPHVEKQIAKEKKIILKESPNPPIYGVLAEGKGKYAGTTVFSWQNKV